MFLLHKAPKWDIQRTSHGRSEMDNGLEWFWSRRANRRLDVLASTPSTPRSALIVYPSLIRTVFLPNQRIRN